MKVVAYRIYEGNREKKNIKINVKFFEAKLSKAHCD